MVSCRVRFAVLAIIVASVFAGCGADTATEQHRAASTAAATAATNAATPSAIVTADGSRVLLAPAGFTPPQGSGDQVLTLAGSTSAPVSLDPAVLRDAESAFVARQVFRGLVRLDEELLPQPDLAERIEISANGRVYTFTLRAGATFQDGSPLDAAAVAASFHRATDPALADGDGAALPAAIYLVDIEGARERLAGETDRISGIETPDERTVRITLARPVANFLFKLAGAPGWIVDVASARGEEWWRSPNGSGPFRIVRLEDDGSIELERWAGFWGGAPALERVFIRGGADAVQPLNLYEAGRIDVTDTPFYAVDRVLSPTDALNRDLVVVPQLSTTFIALSPQAPLYEYPALRQAIALAFDRAKVAGVMFDGKVREAEGIIPPGILDRSWPATFAAHDPDQARELASTVAFDGLRPRLFDPGGGIGSALRRVLQRDLGVELDVIDVDWPVFSGMLTDGTLDGFVLTWIADYPDPANFVAALFHSESPDNYLGYANPVVDRLLDEAEVETDANRRAELYLQAQQRIIDDGVVIPLYHDVSYTLIKPWVRGLTVTPVGILSLEDVWIDIDGD